MGRRTEFFQWNIVLLSELDEIDRIKVLRCCSGSGIWFLCKRLLKFLAFHVLVEKKSGPLLSRDSRECSCALFEEFLVFVFIHFLDFALRLLLFLRLLLLLLRLWEELLLRRLHVLMTTRGRSRRNTVDEACCWSAGRWKCSSEWRLCLRWLLRRLSYCWW